MTIIVTILHVMMCVILIAIVLLQTGKGANLGASFGGASQTLFGGAGPASFLNKITTVAAVVFMLTSFALTVTSMKQAAPSKVLNATPVQQTQPANTETTPTTTKEESAAPASATPATGEQGNAPTPGAK